MSNARRARERKAVNTEQSYSKADEALWDDAYLLQLFNEQLENSTAVSEPAHPAEHSATSSRSSTHSGTASSRSSSSHSASATSSSAASQESSVTLPLPPAVSGAAAAAATSAGGLPMQHLPADIQILIQSFYNAGFEAGRYVGRSESAAAASRKRQR